MRRSTAALFTTIASSCAILAALASGCGDSQTCEADADCTRGDLCDGGECVECVHDEHCSTSSGEQCIAGACVTSTSSGCTSDAQCQEDDPNLVCEARQCVGCGDSRCAAEIDACPGNCAQFCGCYYSCVNAGSDAEACFMSCDEATQPSEREVQACFDSLACLAEQC